MTFYKVRSRRHQPLLVDCRTTAMEPYSRKWMQRLKVVTPAKKEGSQEHKHPMDSRVNRSLQVIRPPTVKPSNIIDYSPLKQPIVPPQPSLKRASTVATINTLKQIFAARGTLSRSRTTTTAPAKTQRPFKGNGIAFTSKARLERVRSAHSLVSCCLQTRRV